MAVNRLRRLAPLDEAEERLLLGLDDWRFEPAGAQLVRDLSSATPRLLVSGWAARVRWLSDGRRQIIGFVAPGDGIAICHQPRALALTPIVALTAVQTLDAAPLLKSLTANGALGQALHIAASLDEAWLIDQVVRLGRLAAYERIAHLLLEIRSRLVAVGLGTGHQFPFPLTQEMMADASGLSVVHVNRTLQHLRREGFIELQSGRITFLDLDGLIGLADFKDPLAEIARSTPEDPRRRQQS